MTEFVSHTRCVWATSSEASPFNAVVLINSSRPFTPYIFAAIDTIERKHIFNITQKHWTGFLHFTVRWPAWRVKPFTGMSMCKEKSCVNWSTLIRVRVKFQYFRRGPRPSWRLVRSLLHCTHLSSISTPRGSTG